MRPETTWERYIRFADLQRQFPADSGTAQLTLGELNELGRFRDSRRRETWIWGRLIAKQLIVEHLTGDIEDWTALEILSRNERGQAVRPQITLDGQALHWGLSISHSDRGLLVAICPQDDLRIGVDLAAEDDFSQGFLETWFSPREREETEGAERLEIVTRWAIKEAVFKACNTGEGFAPRKIEVLRQGDGFCCSYQGRPLPPATRYNARCIDQQIAATVLTPSALWDTADASHERSIAFAGGMRSHQ